MKKLHLLSKARTLENLSKVISSAKILPLYIFSVADFNNKQKIILEQINTNFLENVIIRSSSYNEDNTITSNAGGFDSIMDVNINKPTTLIDSINKVIDSYGIDANQKDEIFVQPMLKDITMSGVIFSADIDTLSPYYVINYDERGYSDTVTSGRSNNIKNFICFKETNHTNNSYFNNLIQATKECEKLFNNSFLDIEFAFSNEQLYILQVRAIITHNKENLSNINLSNSLYKLNKKIKKLNTSHPNLLGKKTIFGVMPDWNPAEIIGIRPKKLALSLYKELITDETWAYQRDNYGYRNLRSHPLMVSFLGVPFIDVRVSFNSFIPKDLDQHIAEKLVNYYIHMLSENINYHDKVEFEIIYSCYYFGLDRKLLKLKEYNFEDIELEKIKTSLLNLTNNIIDTDNDLYKNDLKKIKFLEEKFTNMVSSDLSLIDKIYWLIKDVKRYGTLPFAGIARASFIAVQILHSFIDEGIITKTDYNLFLNSLNTITKQLSYDLTTLSKDEFLTVYGHLRPGSYDIMSKRYDEAYDDYFKNTSKSTETKKEKFIFSKQQQQQINQLITKHALKTTSTKLINFIRESIEGREYAKYLFTKHLSQTLRYIEIFGRKYGFSNEDLSYIDIQEIIKLYSTLDPRNVKDIIDSDIQRNKIFYQFTKAVKLPNLIVKPDDIYSFYLDDNLSNFITLKKTKALIINEHELKEDNCQNKIVCIQSADPGYDYLFLKNIAGLITCYGGANSHMAIRCAEMGIPAVIGCGENNFSKFSNSKEIELDALNERVTIFS